VEDEVMTGQHRGRRERRGFTISVAAEIVKVHQQTLRHYERLGLIEPLRGKGEIRYYSPEDIERVQQIRRLVEELGVNLAGVEVILNMRDQMERLRRETQAALERMEREHEAETRRLKEIITRVQGAWHDIQPV
jgi:MerR family transcriptional regulator/heat shock protein HspR